MIYCTWGEHPNHYFTDMIKLTQYKNRNYIIIISLVNCFSAKHTSLRRKSKDGLARNQYDIYEWNRMSTTGLLFHWDRTACLHLDCCFIEIEPHVYLWIVFHWDRNRMSNCGLLFHWGRTACLPVDCCFIEIEPHFYLWTVVSLR